MIEGDELLELIAFNRLRLWSPELIEDAVKAGEPICICDNLVLRTDGYERLHPGGKFTIVKNFGRDIAKFYYGNYALQAGNIIKPHTHSRQANLILESMIVGVIEDQHDAQEVPMKLI